MQTVKPIKVKIKPSKHKGYNFDYIFIGNNKIYIEYLPVRYIKLLAILKDYIII
jgi:hypothetical protein